MTGQFLQWKYAPCPAAAASHCAITPALCPSHLISFCHLSAHAGLLLSLSLPPPSFSHPPLPPPPTPSLHAGTLLSFYWRSTSRPSCSRRRRRLHPSWCRSLNPPSFALLGPLPSRFSPAARFFAALSHFHLLLCVSLVLPDSFPPPPSLPLPPQSPLLLPTCAKVHHHPSLLAFLFPPSGAFATNIIRLTSVCFLSLHRLSITPL